jgi:hypothetical protein
VQLPSDSAVEILIKEITGSEVGTNAKVPVPVLVVTPGVEERKIGQHGADGDYTHLIAQNYRQVHSIALILRGRAKKDRG